MTINLDDVSVRTIMLKMLREAYEQHKGSTLEMDDDTLIGIVKDQGDEAESLDPENWADIIEDVQSADDAENVLSVSADRIDERERNMAAKLDADHWKAFQNEDIRTNDFRKQAHALAARLIEQDFTKEERDVLPVFGTTKDGDAAKGIPASNNPDVYKRPALNGKQETAHRLWDIVDASSVGQFHWDMYNRTYDARYNVEGCDKKLFAKGNSWLDSELKMIKQRIGVIRTSFVKGLAVVRQREQINETLKGKVIVDFAIGENNELRRGANCIEVASDAILPNGRRDKAHSFVTTGQLLRLNIVKAVAGGGTYEALMGTIARGKKKEAPPAASQQSMAKTREEFLSQAAMQAHYLDNASDDGRKRFAGLVALCAVEGDEGDTATEILGDVCMAYDELWNIIGKRHTAIKQRKAAQDRAPSTKLAKAS